MKPDKLNQVKKIVEYADKHGIFTYRKLYEKLHINSPTGRVSDMRKLGYKFEQTWKESENSRYIEFKIIESPKEIK